MKLFMFYEILFKKDLLKVIINNWEQFLINIKEKQVNDDKLKMRTI